MTTQMSAADTLGIEPAMTVTELGYGRDVDEALRTSVIERCGSELRTGSTGAADDVVLVWFRESDGDLIDILTEARTWVAQTGAVWLLTPKTGRPGYVEPSDIGEASPSAGLRQSTTVSACRDWLGTRLIAPTTAGRR